MASFVFTLTSASVPAASAHVDESPSLALALLDQRLDAGGHVGNLNRLPIVVVDVAERLHPEIAVTQQALEGLFALARDSARRHKANIDDRGV